ncbi:MAG: hemoglobin/transferrin/lactoferrin receptor protein [Candidatus Azotimanducaceae bacterium]
MNRFITFFIFLFCANFYAQEITVLDYELNLPISNCTIYNESKLKVVHTDKNGKGDISIFKENEILSFNHISFVEIEVLKRELKEGKSTVFLHRKAEALDEVILSTSRQKVTRIRIAEHVEIMQQKDIARSASQTSADLLASIPGIKVQKSQFGGGSPVLRGMEANRILLVVDGVRMNNAIYRSGHLQSSISVSPSVLERTEVVFGPSSVIYGSDALGGVIHYYTKTPKTGLDKMMNVDFMTRFGTVNNESTQQGSVELSFKKWGSLTSFSHSDFGDLRMGNKRRHGYEDWGKVFDYSLNTDSYYSANSTQNSNLNIQKNTGYNQSDLLQKFYFGFSDRTNLTFNIQYSTSSDIPRFDKLTERSSGELKFSEWYYGPQKRFLVSSQLSIRPGKKWMNNGTITGAYQNIIESRVQRKFTSLDRSYRNEMVDVYSLNGDFSVQLGTTSNRKLSYGVEITHNYVKSGSTGKTLDVDGNTIIGFANDFIVQSRYPDGGSSYDSFSGYVSYRQDVTPKSTLNTGVRYTYTNLKARWIDDTYIALPSSDISIDNGAITATAGYTYRPNRNWQLNAVISSGFRSPNIDDVGKIREKNGQVTVPNIQLRPEYSYSAEIGVLKYLNDKKFNLGLNIYYSLLDKYISREQFSLGGNSAIIYDGEEVETYANVNNNNAYVAGTTFSFGGKVIDNLKINGSITYTKGESTDTNLPLSSIPPIFGDLEVLFAKNRFEVALNFRFNGSKELNEYNLVEGIDNIEQSPFNISTQEHLGTPSWNTFNFYSKHKISKALSLQVNIDNIFDIHYKEFASGISSAGRNFSLSLFFNN